MRSFRSVGHEINKALMRMVGGGHSGADSNTSGKASMTARALSKAPSPKTIRTLVAAKKIASSTSRLPQTVKPSLVPDSMAHVPRRSASSSTTQRYKVGRAIGRVTLVQGRRAMNSPPRVHVRRAKGHAHINMRPIYVPGPPFDTSQNPSSVRLEIAAWTVLCTALATCDLESRYSA